MLQYKHFKGVNARVHVLDDTSELHVSKTFKKLNMKLQIVFNFQSWMFNKEIMIIIYIFFKLTVSFLAESFYSDVILFWWDSSFLKQR